MMILVIKSAITVTCFSHSGTIPRPPLGGSIIFRESNPRCQKGWGPLPCKDKLPLRRRESLRQQGGPDAVCESVWLPVCVCVCVWVCVVSVCVSVYSRIFVCRSYSSESVSVSRSVVSNSLRPQGL